MTVNGHGHAYQSWGRYPQVEQQHVVPVYWRNNGLDLANIDGPISPYGLGRSYGDSCLNGGGTLLNTAPLTCSTNPTVSLALIAAPA